MYKNYNNKAGDATVEARIRRKIPQIMEVKRVHHTGDQGFSGIAGL